MKRASVCFFSQSVVCMPGRHDCNKDEFRNEKKKGIGGDIN